MTRVIALDGLALLVGFGLGTWALGWWAVPGIAVVWGASRPAVARPWVGAVTAALAWGLLLVVDASSAAMARLLERLSGVFQLPGWALIVVTLGFPWLLAWSGVRVGKALRKA